MKKYIGQKVTLIYMDKKSRITQRCVRILALQDNRVKVYCYLAKSPRILLIDNILAVRSERRVI
ncbi:hypothetical protein EBB07_12770 [Paenibacillaceae bacterium]|nr:hypothetical protein EBB07_12770 [Paenibacillaceae bacterium]